MIWVDERKQPARQGEPAGQKRIAMWVGRAFVRAEYLCYIGNGTVNLICVNLVRPSLPLSRGEAFAGDLSVLCDKFRHREDV